MQRQPCFRPIAFMFSPILVVRLPNKGNLKMEGFSVAHGARSSIFRMREVRAQEFEATVIHG